jgi:hypothetical protein
MKERAARGAALFVLVIKYGVGAVIRCRMCLVFYIDPKELIQIEQYFTMEINEAVLFGSVRNFENLIEHQVTNKVRLFTIVTNQVHVI